MRIAVFSDIHANISAFEAVLSLTDSFDMEGYIFLGDLIGYLTHPRETIAHFLDLEGEIDPEKGLFQFVMGNHEELFHLALTRQAEWDKADDDEAMAGYTSREYRWIALLDELIERALGVGIANKPAVDGIYRNFRALAGSPELEWLRSVLTGNENDFFKSFDFDGVHFQLVHGGLAKPARYYVMPWSEVDLKHGMAYPFLENGYKKGRQHCILFGHTHIPTFARVNYARGDIKDIQDVDFEYGEEYSWDADLVMINPGSVGLPRDGDPRPSFAVLDTQARTVRFYRLNEYESDDIEDELFAAYTQKIQDYFINAPIPNRSDKPITPEYIERFENRKKLPGCEVNNEQ